MSRSSFSLYIYFLIGTRCDSSIRRGEYADYHVLSVTNSLCVCGISVKLFISFRCAALRCVALMMIIGDTAHLFIDIFDRDIWMVNLSIFLPHCRYLLIIVSVYCCHLLSPVYLCVV